METNILDAFYFKKRSSVDLLVSESVRRMAASKRAVRRSAQLSGNPAASASHGTLTGHRRVSLEPLDLVDTGRRNSDHFKGVVIKYAECSDDLDILADDSGHSKEDPYSQKYLDHAHHEPVSMDMENRTSEPYLVLPNLAREYEDAMPVQRKLSHQHDRDSIQDQRIQYRSREDAQHQHQSPMANEMNHLTVGAAPESNGSPSSSSGLHLDRRSLTYWDKATTSPRLERNVKTASLDQPTPRSTGPDENTQSRLARLEPLQRFRHVARNILNIVKATRNTSNKQRSEANSKLLSFAQYQDEILNNKTSFYGGIAFNPQHYKAQKESPLSAEARLILSREPAERSADQLHTAVLALQTAVDAFSEFPINMQTALVRVGWYEHFEAKRVIIRQGHTADNFYFIISGTAVVTLLETNKATGEAYSRTLALLGKGNSFGELALMHGAKRSATVTCQDDVELLAVGREDFIDIFMHIDKDRSEPEHIAYLRSVDVLVGWPVEVLPWDNPRICLFTFFRRGTVMCRDSNRSDWVYVIKSGSCRVLTSLTATSPSIGGLQQLQYSGDAATAPRQYSHKLPSLSSPRPLTGSSSANLPLLVQLHDQVKRARSTLNPKALPAINGQQAAGSAELMHRQSLEEVYRRHHDPSQQSGSQRDGAKRRAAPPQRLFVQVQKLGPKDTFGLEHVAFSIMGACTSVSMVSDGAEAILINKKFFIKHLSDVMQKKLRSTIRPYPSEESLQQKLQDKTNWEAFKSMTVTDHVTYHKFVHNILEL